MPGTEKRSRSHAASPGLTRSFEDFLDAGLILTFFDSVVMIFGQLNF